MCEKVSYPTREAARNAVCGLQDKRGKFNKSKRQPTKTYYCIQCLGWHVSSAKKRRFNKTYKNTLHDVVIMHIKPKEDKEFLIIQNYTGRKAA
jgi:hypothetical protein